jgi:hypothetical protein
MAESRHKIRAIGAPFDVEHSSCSNLKPTHFDWTTQPSEYDVYIDRRMMYQPDHSIIKEKRFGWVCESRFIVPDLYSFLIHNHKLLFNNYYNKIFTCDNSLLELNSNFVFCPSGSNYPWIRKEQWSVYHKIKLCSMFCSPKLLTEGHVYRHQIARLALDKGFDVFGGAHGTPRTVTDFKNPWNTKLDGVKDYMFSIVVENGVYDSYWTEKITDCFATGTVPVYCGTKKILDFFDSDGIIFLEQGKEEEISNSLSKELYNSKLTAITNNFNAVAKIKLADDILWEKINETVNN